MDEIAQKIIEITQDIQSRKIQDLTGDQVSWYITKLAILRVNLGIELAQAVNDYDLSYIGRKINYAKEYTRFKNTVEEKLTQKDLDTATIMTIGDLMKQEMELKKAADSLRLLYETSQILISSLQSRLRVLTQERKDSVS